MSFIAKYLTSPLTIPFPKKTGHSGSSLGSVTLDLLTHQMALIGLWLCLLVSLSACQMTKKSEASDPVANKLTKKMEVQLVVPLPDPATFDDISDEELEGFIVDIADNQVSSNDDNPYAALELLPDGYQVVYSTWRLESEVNSGGFYQYFHDTNAKFSFLAQRAFKDIHAPITGKLLKRAMMRAEEKMPNLLDPDRNPQPYDEKALKKSNPLLDLDNEFFDGNENLSELRIKYIRSHLKLFKPSSAAP